MNINILENSWVVEITDINLQELTRDEANIIGKYLLTNTTVVIRQQSLSPSDEKRVCTMFGDIQDLSQFKMKEDFLLPDDEKKIIRVTGELNEHGEPGMFGHAEELEWHANRVSDPNRDPVIWLYAERGSNGSITSYLNNILAYADLSDTKKDQIKDYTLNVGATMQFLSYYTDGREIPPDIQNYNPKLVYTNALGVTGMFFSWNQIHNINELSDEEGRQFINEMKEHCDQPKYIYEHHWKDGDVVLADQWLSIHKRHAFDRMDQRVLHRIATNYNNISLA